MPKACVNFQDNQCQFYFVWNYHLKIHQGTNAIHTPALVLTKHANLLQRPMAFTRTITLFSLFNSLPGKMFILHFSHKNDQQFPHLYLFSKHPFFLNCSSENTHVAMILLQPLPLKKYYTHTNTHTHLEHPPTRTHAHAHVFEFFFQQGHSISGLGLLCTNTKFLDLPHSRLTSHFLSFQFLLFRYKSPSLSLFFSLSLSHSLTHISLFLFSTFP